MTRSISPKAKNLLANARNLESAADFIASGQSTFGQWCVPGFLPQQGTAVLYGQSGSAKSFLAIHLSDPRSILASLQFTNSGFVGASLSKTLSNGFALIRKYHGVPNMADQVEYRILNAPLLARNLMASRTPRVQPSVPAEFADHVSRMIERNEITIDPENGELLTVKGQDLEQLGEFYLSTRPHCFMPVVLEDEADAVGTSGNLTRQGERLRSLEKFTGSKSACRASRNAALSVVNQA
jgi:hypothetical protein